MDTPQSAGQASVFTPEHFHHGAMQATERGQFPAWWADVWMSNGLGRAYAVDRAWLEEMGRRVDEALRHDYRTREDQLQELMRWLVKESQSGPYGEAAEFFLVYVVADLHGRTVQERHGLSPDSKRARAFGAAVAFIRLIQAEARKRGVELSLAAIDMQGVAELVAKEILRGEGISVTDTLNAIRENTAAIPLAEWIEGAPTRH